MLRPPTPSRMTLQGCSRPGGRRAAWRRHRPPTAVRFPAWSFCGTPALVVAFLAFCHRDNPLLASANSAASHNQGLWLRTPSPHHPFEAAPTATGRTTHKGDPRTLIQSPTGFDPRVFPHLCSIDRATLHIVGRLPSFHAICLIAWPAVGRRLPESSTHAIATLNARRAAAARQRQSGPPQRPRADRYLPPPQPSMPKPPAAGRVLRE